MLKVCDFNCILALGPEGFSFFWNSLKGLLIYVNSVCNRLWLKLIKKVFENKGWKTEEAVKMYVRRCSYELLNRLQEKLSPGSYSLEKKKKKLEEGKSVFFCKRLNWQKFRHSFFGFIFGQFLKCFAAI